MDQVTLIGSALIAATWGASPIFQHFFVSRGVAPSAVALVSGCAYAIGAAMWWLHSSRSSMFGGLTPLQAVGMLLGSGLISTVVPNLIYIYVLSRQGACPTLVSVLAYSAPAFTALYALLFLGQDLTSDQWLGVVLVCMGTAVIGLGGLSRRV